MYQKIAQVLKSASETRVLQIDVNGRLGLFLPRQQRTFGIGMYRRHCLVRKECVKKTIIKGGC